MVKRHKFTQALVAATAASVVALAGFSASAADLTVVSWGGAYQAAQSKALFEPASKAMGLEVAQDSYGGLADIRLQVNSGAVSWDIIDTGAGGAARAAHEGLLMDLDYSIIDVSNFIPGLYMPQCVGTITFSTIMAWNTETYGKDGPQSWADFWDTAKFPGKRSLRNKSLGSLEFGAMAGGVPMDEVYATLSTDDGLEAAIDKFREVKPDVAIWWASGAQHAQLMKDGEVDMSTGWNGRFEVAIQDGGKADYTFNQGILDYDCFGIPKGAPNPELAMKFLAEISKASYQADMPKYIAYGPTNKESYELGVITDEQIAKLPSTPEHAALQLLVDIDWWRLNEARAEEAYQDMLTE